jgi:DNA-binding GntR family transcriptional regulator/pimeloyl-ACP methyl ester carboxylesterase
MTTAGYVSKTDLVVALIRELVITGELAAGEQLRQRDLAQRFGVSQTPVREAMRRLESEGLLVCDTHRGFTVAAPELGPIEENFQIRAALESLGASLAARKIDAAGLARLRDLNDRMRALPDDDPGYADLNREFHFAIYEYARSPLLLALMRLLWASLHGGPRVARTHAESARQHDEILTALGNRDAAGASARTHQHIMDALLSMEPLMAAIVTDDGVTLHAEEAGQGEPLVFIHEFAGDHRSWEPQIRFFSAAYRCVTYAARGYPPSDVPTDPAAYSQARAVADTIAVLDGLGIDRAHLVGLSMGGFTALHLVLSHPDRVRSAVVAGAGYGAQPERAEAFRAESMLTAAAFAAEGAAKVAERYAVGPARVQFQNKNSRGWAEFAAALARHSDLGSALTMRGVQAARPSLYALTDELAQVRIPVLVVVGDEDDGCLEPALMLKRTIPTAGLAVLPRTGHTANLEEPDVFNRAVDGFLAAVARDVWRPRDPRSISDSLL